MQDAQPKERLSVKINSPWQKSAAWARVLEDGRIELELYDYSPEAQANMGNDVAWLYRVETAGMPRLLALLQERTGSAIASDEALLDAFAKGFSHVHAIRDWLRENQIPYEEIFDSWA